MSGRVVNATVDAGSDASLVSCLDALASANRLEILRRLRTPRALREIDVHDADSSTGAPLARQTVRRHLDTLIESGIVQIREAKREYGETSEFVVNHQRIYALSEEVRALAKLRPSIEPEVPTAPGGARAPARRQGHALVLVKGLDEGTMYSLDPVDGRTSWDIGRRRGSGVPLDFDPAVSSEHARIQWDGKAHILEDAGSRNGTTHNMRPLAPGQRVLLEHGDIVGVGVSLLVYWR